MTRTNLESLLPQDFVAVGVNDKPLRIERVDRITKSHVFCTDGPTAESKYSKKTGQQCGGSLLKILRKATNDDVAFVERKEAEATAHFRKLK